MSGTPKTLREAIQNGLISQVNDPHQGLDHEIVEKHVVDFLAQKFGAHELNFRGQETAALWEMITGKKYGE